MTAPWNTNPQPLNQCLRCHGKNKHYAKEGYHSSKWHKDHYDLVKTVSDVTEDRKSSEKERWTLQ